MSPCPLNTASMLVGAPSRKSCSAATTSRDTALGAQPEPETVAPPQRGKSHPLGQLSWFGRFRATLGGGLGRQARTRHSGHADDAAGLEKRSTVMIHGSPVSLPASLIGAAYAPGQ